MPKRVAAVAFFNKALIPSYPMRVQRAVEKARATDCNDQLQEAGVAVGSQQEGQ